VGTNNRICHILRSVMYLNKSDNTIYPRWRMTDAFHSLFLQTWLENPTLTPYMMAAATAASAENVLTAETVHLRL
jgi:hypothetical protein